MDISDNPGFLFRKTSLTMRLRFTPARPCSTRTRIRASVRLVCFSDAVRSRPRGFFFRLVCPPHRRLIPLEPGVLVQDDARRVRQTLPVGDALVMDLAGIRRAEEQD